MVRNIEHLAREFEAKLGPKIAAKRGKRMTSKKILRNLGKTKKSYKEFRTKLKTLESELDRIESQIREY